jgi:hypothetical protein
MFSRVPSLTSCGPLEHNLSKSWKFCPAGRLVRNNPHRGRLRLHLSAAVIGDQDGMTSGPRYRGPLPRSLLVAAGVHNVEN